MTFRAAAWGVARRELQRWLEWRMPVLLLLVLPLLGSGLLVATFRSAVPRELPVAFVDGDGTLLSRELRRRIDALPGAQVVEAADPAAAQELLLRGRVYGIVLVPPGLARDAARGGGTPVVAFTGSSYLLPASLLRRDLRGAVASVSAERETALRRLRGESRPQLEPIRIDRHTLANPQLSYVPFLLAALLPTLLQMFVLLHTVEACGRELREGTAGEWLAAAGGRLAPALLGKLGPALLAHALLAAFLLALLHGPLDVPQRGSQLAVAAAFLLFLLALQAIGVLVVAVTANLRLATSVAAFLSGTAFAYAGVTFPVLGMPWAGRAWAGLLPLTHLLNVMLQQGQRAAPLLASLPDLLALALLGLVPLALSWVRLSRVLRDPAMQGRL
jgi:ABC-2 type transport system permease protein